MNPGAFEGNCAVLRALFKGGRALFPGAQPRAAGGEFDPAGEFAGDGFLNWRVWKADTSTSPGRCRKMPSGRRPAFSGRIIPRRSWIMLGRQSGRSPPVPKREGREET